MCFFWRAREFWNHTCVTRLLKPVTEAMRSRSCPSGLLSIWKLACSTCNCSSVNVVLTRFALLLWYPSTSQPSVHVENISKQENKQFYNRNIYGRKIRMRNNIIIFLYYLYEIQCANLKPTITGCCATFDRFQIVRFAQDPFVEQRKLFAGWQLAAACVARKTGQVKDQLTCTSYPIRCRYATAAFRALGTKVSVYARCWNG